MTRIWEKFNEKIYPNGHEKTNKKIVYLSTLGGGGGAPTKLEKSNFFFLLNPSLRQPLLYIPPNICKFSNQTISYGCL